MKYTHEDGTPFTKEEFLQKLKTDKEFNDEFGNKGIDQISELIRLLKETPDSRRMVVSAWAVHDLPNMVLPPCHYGFQVYTRELSHDERFELYKKVCGRDLQPHITGINFKQFHFDEFNIPTRAISLMWNQRSCDVLLGIPFNIASYGLLLMMIADEVNMVPDELIGNLGDTHLYLNHIEQAKEQIGRELSYEERLELIKDNKDFLVKLSSYSSNEDVMRLCDEFLVPRRTREPFELPTVHVRDGIFCSSPNDIILENYKSHPAIKAPLSN